MVYSASLDKALKDEIMFDCPTSEFCQLLVSTLVDYGKLGDDRDALEAVLEAAKKYVGKEKQDQCDQLILELHNVIEEHKNEVTPHPSDEKKQDKQPTTCLRSWPECHKHFF